jgi:hypothetical protein
MTAIWRSIVETYLGATIAVDTETMGLLPPARSVVFGPAL